jgi:LacI family transcriptional regulator
MQLALSRIKAYGYSRVALMLNKLQDDLSEQRFYASFLYSKTFAEHGLEYFFLRLSDDEPMEVRKRRGREWIEKVNPDVIIGEQIFWDMLGEMGWKVPDRVAFVSVFWSQYWPNVGGVDQDAEAIGRNVVDLVVGQLVRNERGLPRNPKLLLSEGIWMDGPSCPNRLVTGARRSFSNGKRPKRSVPTT